MMNKLSRAYNPLLHFDDLMGVPLAGGKLCTFAGGKAVCTYKDENGTPHPEEIRLNSRGEADVWLDPAVTYRFVLKNKFGATVYAVDHVTANTKTFSAEGSDTIEATEQVVDGKTVVTFRVKEGSIGVKEFKNPLPLVAGDGIKLTPHDVGGTTVLVVELSDDVKRKLETM